MNALALKNIPFMLVTADVSQVPMGWSNDVAEANMRSIVVTADVSQFPIG